MQRLASVLVITRFSLIRFNYFLSRLSIRLFILLKLGAAPLHQWAPSVADGLNWPSIFILMRFQKINPLILLSITNKANLSVWVIYFFIARSRIIGATGGLIQTSLRKIIIYSSISHLRWLLAGLFVSEFLCSLYFIFYFIMLILVVSIFYTNKFYTLNHALIRNKTHLGSVFILNLLSLGGMPPLMGFIAKLILVQEMINQRMLILLVPLLAGTFLSLFFYLRVGLIRQMMMVTSNKSGLFDSKGRLVSVVFNRIGLLLPSLFFILWYKLYVKKTKSLQSFH